MNRENLVAVACAGIAAWALIDQPERNEGFPQHGNAASDEFLILVLLVHGSTIAEKARLSSHHGTMEDSMGGLGISGVGSLHQ